MLIVAVETSGREGSIALCRGDRDSFEVLQLTSLEGGMYSAQLMPRIADSLQRNNLSKTQVDGFVVVSGPGSFTGLRVGLATVKGLCEVLQKPLATISMLEGLALTHATAGQMATVVLDAGRGEVYVGEYRVAADRANVVREYIAKPAALVAKTAEASGQLLTPDGEVADALRAASVDPLLVPRIHADEVGRLGIRKLLAGETADPATIDVNYIRRSDAELFSAPKH